MRFDNVAVLRDDQPGGSILDVVGRMANKLTNIDPDYPPFITLRGCIYQAQEDYTRAANAYKAGTYFLLGDEFLRTAKGFAAFGDPKRAWREAILSKFMQPGNPEVHTWLAQQLQQEGYANESRAETQVANALRTAARTP